MFIYFCPFLPLSTLFIGGDKQRRSEMSIQQEGGHVLAHQSLDSLRGIVWAKTNCDFADEEKP